MIQKIGNAKVESAVKDAIKAHLDIAEGASASGFIIINAEYTVTRGLGYEKSIPQIACPWTLLAYALKIAGFQRERIVEIVQAVMAMDDAQRKEMREDCSEVVAAAMATIGTATIRQVAGMQTFPTLTYTIEDASA